MLDRFRRGLEISLVVICVSLMAGLALMVVTAALSRKFGHSFTWYDEVASVVLAWITYYGAALAALKRAHLGFPNVVASLGPKLRVVLVLISEALVLFFFAMVTWFGLQVVLILEGDTLTSLPWVPVQLTQSVIPIGGALYIVAELLTLPDRLAEALRGRPAFDPEIDPLIGPGAGPGSIPGAGGAAEVENLRK